MPVRGSIATAISGIEDSCRWYSRHDDLSGEAPVSLRLNARIETLPLILRGRGLVRWRISMACRIHDLAHSVITPGSYRGSCLPARAGPFR